jgi:3,4-dihydroxy-2-butanone 4-phosphate synthase
MHFPASRVADHDISRHDSISSGEFRRALSNFATGVTVVTTRGTAGDYAMTLNSFTSVSLDPALILVCVRASSPGRVAIAANGAFAVNVMSVGQEALSRRFARRNRPRGPDTFTGVNYGIAQTGSPILAGVAAYLDCRLVTTNVAGDHAIFVGEVVDFHSEADLPPLLFHGGRYQGLTGEPLSHAAVADGPDTPAPWHATCRVSAEEAIDEISAGRMVVVWDGNNRQNEGDLTLAAEKVTPDAINFMAREGRGIVSLPLSRERCDRLELTPMTTHNESPFGTAFTVAVEAREGVATGISARDRARTIRVTCDPESSPRDLVRPGHVFPLRARPGGVLQRAGHTEAAVDLAQLAGMAPAGVVCQVMNADGTMARLPDLIRFCERHRLKMVSIADLIEHRRQTVIRQQSRLASVQCRLS